MELKGSKTEKNLVKAFAGESQARNKYTYFADVAKGEGLDGISAAFLEAAENEKTHAKRELGFLQAMGDTEANLKAAAEGEHGEWESMYPGFEKVAHEEGFTEIADFFARVAQIEAEHEKRFLALLDDVKKGKIHKKDHEVTWKCRSCGWIQKGAEPPTDCPTCHLANSSFDSYPWLYRAPMV
jgi:rubrerythrin